MKCKICESESFHFSDAVIMKKYHITYSKCPNCGFIQTEEPYWLDEAYSSAIADSDIGLVSRNFTISNTISAILKISGIHTEKCLDYGGGYGMFVRLMRDKGFYFERYDKYAENLFAKTFDQSEKHYDIVTAFEVWEHLANPLSEINNMMQLGDTVIITTELLNTPAQKPSEWWYYALDSGQHIAFYTEKAMQIIADKFNRYYIHNGSYHFFSKKPISQKRILIACKYPNIINKAIFRQNLITSDYEKITGRTLN